MAASSKFVSESFVTPSLSVSPQSSSPKVRGGRVNGTKRTRATNFAPTFYPGYKIDRPR